MVLYVMGFAFDPLVSNHQQFARARYEVEALAAMTDGVFEVWNVSRELGWEGELPAKPLPVAQYTRAAGWSWRP